MGRIRTKIDQLDEAPLLQAKLKNEKPGWRRERMLVIKMALEGHGNRQIAQKFERSPVTVQSWVNKFREGGLEGLLSKKKGTGFASRFTPEMQKATAEQLAQGKWRTAGDAAKWLKEEYQLDDVSMRSIYLYLGKCGGRLKATRPCNPDKDPAAEVAFKEKLAENMLALNIKRESPVRLWVYDEMRYGLHPLTRKMWCLKGVRAIAPSRRRYLNGYLYGALEVGGAHGSEFLFTPSLNKQWDKTFLKQLGESDPESVHVVIGDGAGFHHRSGDEQLPTNVRVITLPAYSPELNPVEKLWDIVKDGICNVAWPDLESLEQRITERIRPYWLNVKRVSQLIGNSYLPSELNAMPH